MLSTKHRDTAGQTESNQIALSHVEAAQNTPKHRHTRTEGSNPSLSATANPEKTGQAGQSEINAWLDGLVKPLIQLMDQRGIRETHISRKTGAGRKYQFELVPEEGGAQ